MYPCSAWISWHSSRQPQPQKYTIATVQYHPLKPTSFISLAILSVVACHAPRGAIFQATGGAFYPTHNGENELSSRGSNVSIWQKSINFSFQMKFPSLLRGSVEVVGRSLYRQAEHGYIMYQIYKCPVSEFVTSCALSLKRN